MFSGQKSPDIFYRAFGPAAIALYGGLMLLKSETNLSRMARMLAKEIENNPEGSIPKEYLNLEGFRLTQEPKRRKSALFLGSFEAWGNEDLKLCPKTEFLFHESDVVITRLKSPVCRSVGAGKRKKFIDAAEFEKFCSNLIPEKIVFVIEDELLGPLALETIQAVKRAGARAIFNAEVARLDQGLFYRSLDSVCQIKAQRDLAEIGLGRGERSSLYMAKRKLRSESLGSFISSSEGGEHGIVAQVEFAQFEEWEIERARWECLRQSRAPGGWMISSGL